MGGGAREIVVDIVTEFRCRNDSGGIYKFKGFTLGYTPQGKVPLSGDDSMAID